MSNDETTAGIGDNKPSESELLRDQLVEKYDARLKKRTAELVAQLHALPDPLPDDKLEEASELIKASQVHLRKIDALRVAEKSPYLEGGRVVDGYFGNFTSQLVAARAEAKPIFEKAHDRRGGIVRTDHGVTVTQVEGWDYIVWDWGRLPKETLWQYLSRDAIDAAIKVAVDNGVRQLDGVNIFPRKTSIVR